MPRSCKLAGRCAWVAAGLLAIAGQAVAQNPPAAAPKSAAPVPAPPKAVPPPPRPGDVNLERSRVFVHTGAKGFGHEHGIAGQLTGGNLQLGADKNAGKLTFDMASFADEPEARTFLGIRSDEDPANRRKINSTMHGGSVLDVKQFPQATFEVNSATLVPGAGGAATYALDGKLTLRGKTRPIKFEAQVDSAEGLVRLRGHFTIKQTDFGIHPYSKLGGAVAVADEVKIAGDIWLQPPAKK